MNQRRWEYVTCDIRAIQFGYVYLGLKLFFEHVMIGFSMILNVILENMEVGGHFLLFTMNKPETTDLQLDNI